MKGILPFQDSDILLVSKDYLFQFIICIFADDKNEFYIVKYEKVTSNFIRYWGIGIRM